MSMKKALISDTINITFIMSTMTLTKKKKSLLIKLTFSLFNNFLRDFHSMYLYRERLLEKYWLDEHAKSLSVFEISTHLLIFPANCYAVIITITITITITIVITITIIITVVININITIAIAITITLIKKWKWVKNKSIFKQWAIIFDRCNLIAL